MLSCELACFIFSSGILDSCIILLIFIFSTVNWAPGNFVILWRNYGPSSLHFYWSSIETEPTDFYLHGQGKWLLSNQWLILAGVLVFSTFLYLQHISYYYTSFMDISGVISLCVQIAWIVKLLFFSRNFNNLMTCWWKDSNSSLKSRSQSWWNGLSVQVFSLCTVEINTKFAKEFTFLSFFLSFLKC